MSKGIASLAKQVASEGRGGDSTLLHIHPSELAGIEAILRQLDPDVKITLNPETGMYEAFSLKKLLGAIGLGASAAMLLVPGLQPAAIAGLKGSTAALMSSVVAPALISGASSLATGAFAPDTKKSNQQQLSDARKYIEDINKREYSRQRFTDFLSSPITQVQTQQQPQSQNQGIGSVLPMGNPLFSFKQALANITPPAPAEEDETRGFAEGGSLEPEEEKAQKIIRDAMDAIRGEGADPEGALNTYIAYYLSKNPALREQLENGKVTLTASGFRKFFNTTYDEGYKQGFNQEPDVEEDDYIPPPSSSSSIDELLNLFGMRK